MKAKAIALLLVLFTCAVALSCDLWPEGEKPDAPTMETSLPFEPVPDFVFTTPDSQTHHIEDLSEKAILLHFWASWCVPCQAELPQLIKRVAEADGRLALLAISTDDDKEAMRQFIDRQPGNKTAHLYWVWDEDKAISLKLFNTVSVPETILIDRQRRMVDKVVGDPDWANRKMGERLDALSAP